MWKNIVLLALLITISSCGSKKVVVEKGTNNTIKESADMGESVDLSYQSLGNDIGDVSLHLYKNHTFQFKMKVFASEEDDDSKNTHIDAKGTYTCDGDWKTLHFKNPKFSLAAIFDGQYANLSEVKLIDKETVKINTSKNALPIWGILCEKE